jgi:sugar phosphate isomerase/epimerase
MTAMKGPAIFLTQFLGDVAPFDTLDHLARWAAGLGYVGMQIPCDPRLIDLSVAAESQDYCDDLKGMLAGHGIEATELSTHLQGQLVAVHPAYDALFDGFAPPELRGKPVERQAWARRWIPILDVFEDAGVDCAYEIHPGEDIHDGASWERFLAAVNHHPRARILFDPSPFVLQQLDYLGFLDRYHDRISCFHVKDAEFNPTGRSGVYGGYENWIDRAGRFRSLGDGQVDFPSIFSKMAQYGYAGWAVLEWECALKNSADGAREGAPFIRDHIIGLSERSFDDFAASGADRAAIRSLLGLSPRSD